MYFVKSDVTWNEVNAFMHSFAGLLDKKDANNFYDNIQVYRLHAKKPDDLLEVVLQEVEKYIDVSV